MPEKIFRQNVGSGTHIGARDSNLQPCRLSVAHRRADDPYARNAVLVGVRDGRRRPVGLDKPLVADRRIEAVSGISGWKRLTRLTR